MGIVSCIPERCKRCYACIRECPAKAIKVVKGEAWVIEERCIACGNCVKVCAQNAKRIEDSTPDVTRMLEQGSPVIACLAPSFPAAFDSVAPKKVVTALRRLGFAEIWSVAFGAELVSREYSKLFKASCQHGNVVITSPCPAVVSYVEKYLPEVRHMLAPIVSPMIAVARAIRSRYPDNRLRIVFIGPCIAKKNESREPSVAGAVDSVLTYRELDALFEENGVILEDMVESEFDSPSSVVGWSFPLSSGILRTSGIGWDVLNANVLSTEGKERVLAVLEEVAGGGSRAQFVDLLFCEGCINGPKMLNELGVHARKEILTEFIQHQARGATAEGNRSDLHLYRELDLSRQFSAQDLVLPQPREEDITHALETMRKFSPEDHLNCGACGYPTCREKAIAVCQGLAEAAMCLPYLVDQLETTCEQLHKLNQELATTQQRLVQTERLASMGQLSAGVAHEINNPLGTVLIYSHMLLREIEETNPMRADMEMIVREATRCKGIVRSLLDFARQSRVSKTPTDLASLFQEIEAIMGPRAQAAGVELACEVAPDVPVVMIDAEQVKQVLVNLMRNGIEAVTHDKGCVRLTAANTKSEREVEIRVTDNGDGIPEEHLSRLFTPFFTTKEMGKGTGLGLAIAYGIIKMHSGDINVESKQGEGTTFTILLPIGSDGHGAMPESQP
ncbi:MAG: ATP-binding protein, partial [Candidatus Hydrogenedentes bacterium]|nr:ATP-binding protein [Candidatus Hydrogenedentota bacterium]